MNPELLDKVLRCRELPSLPAVAMKVVELTSGEQVSFKALAEAIQNDQALAVKVLRTVNSSLYGLRTRCSSINQAIVMLGMSAVKTLALSFSLVSVLKACKTEGFDLPDYWRRALYTAIAARAIATKAQMNNPEECFLGALLQDVGMVALYLSLGRKYLAVLEDTKGDHRKVAKFELDAYDMTHADVGAMLASRWKLPDSLVMPIKYHERPTAAPLEHTLIVRAVGLGNIAADVMIADEPAPVLRRYYARAEQWFALNNGEADDVLQTIQFQVREVAELLSVPRGEGADVQRILEVARERMERTQIHAGEHGTQACPSSDPQASDELTGVASRFQFDRSMIAAFEQARSNVGPMCAAIFDINGLDEVNAQYGQDAGDTVLIAIAGRLEREMEAPGSLVARYDAGRFAVLLPRVSRAAGMRVVESARSAIASEPFKLVAAKCGSPPEIRVSISAGVVCLEPELANELEEPGAVIELVEQAVKAAKAAGRDTVRVYSPLADAA